MQWGVRLFQGWYAYGMTYVEYAAQARHEGVRVRVRLLPKVTDRFPDAHTFDAHYVYMSRWAFAAITKALPLQHVDVGSLISFVAMLSTRVPVTYVDLRPPQGQFSDVTFMTGDVTALPFADGSITSLSCLHVVEHVGLGRYGDVIDVHGTERAIVELGRVLAPGGTLYLALPVGREAVYFNAHRVTSPRRVCELLPGLKLLSWAGVDDAGAFHDSANLDAYAKAQYACGMYIFKKVTVHA